MTRRLLSYCGLATQDKGRRVLAANDEYELQPAALLNPLLAANRWPRFGVSLLQIAADRAARPDQPVTTLKRKRIMARITNAAILVTKPEGVAARLFRTLLHEGALVSPARLPCAVHAGPLDWLAGLRNRTLAILACRRRAAPA